MMKAGDFQKAGHIFVDSTYRQNASGALVGNFCVVSVLTSIEKKVGSLTYNMLDEKY